MFKKRNNSILPPSYGSEVLLWTVTEGKIGREIPCGVGGKEDSIGGDFLERAEVKGGEKTTSIGNLFLPDSSVTRCPFSLNQKAFSVHTTDIIKLTPLWKSS